MLKKANITLTGVIAGIILPGILFFALYFSKFSSIEFIEFPRQMILGKLLPVVLSWCVLPNLLLFFIFSWIDWLHAAKGILASTVVITVLLFALRFIIPLL